MTDSTVESLRNHWENAAPKVQCSSAHADSLTALTTHHRAAHSESVALFEVLAVPGARLLDIYVGVGIDAVDAAERGADVAFATLASTHARETERLAASRKVVIDVAITPPEDLPYKDGSFDAVVARGVLMFAASPTAVLGEIYRVLRPGGQILAVLYSRYSWFTALKALTREPIVHPKNPPIVNLVTSKETEALFEDFVDVEVRWGRFPSLVTDRSGIATRIFNTFLVPGFRLIPLPVRQRLGFYLIVTATKPER